MSKVDLSERIVNGRLTQIGQSFRCIKEHRAAVFQCECGTKKIVDCFTVRSGITKSCGCLHLENAGKLKLSHGHSRGRKRSRTHTCWSGIMKRCLNKNTKNFSAYGGRGITVCDRWRESFENFLSDMGEMPEGLSIDRIDNDGNYCAENCRWATRNEQGRNTRRSRFLTANGKTQSLSDWSDHTGISVATIHDRLKRGWPDDRAINTPVKIQKRK